MEPASTTVLNDTSTPFGPSSSTKITMTVSQYLSEGGPMTFGRPPQRNREENAGRGGWVGADLDDVGRIRCGCFLVARYSVGQTLTTIFHLCRNQTSSGSSRSDVVRPYSVRSRIFGLIPLLPIVVLLKSGPSAGRIAVITEIIDHNRVRLH